MAPLAGGAGPEHGELLAAERGGVEIGRVTAVNLVGFTGGGSAVWQAIRKAAMAQLAGRQFMMKSAFAKGAIVSVGATAVPAA